jgi:3-oxoacyl-[acyl-carrier-protein] synthase-3
MRQRWRPKALEQCQLDRERIGVIINTSVCRDYLEPSTACIVHGNLGLSEDCLNFDVGNACLAFLNGMDIAARMLERDEVDYALIVDGESRAMPGGCWGPISEPSGVASLTSDPALRMIMARGGLQPVLARRVALSDRIQPLCHGQMDQMVTETSSCWVRLARRQDLSRCHRWAGGRELDQFVIHRRWVRAW